MITDVDYFLKHFTQSLSPELLASYRKFDSSTQLQFKNCCFISDFFKNQCINNIDILFNLVSSRTLTHALTKKNYINELEKNISLYDNKEVVMSKLREFRNYHQARIIWREVNNLAHQSHTMMELSNLADTCIGFACHWAHLHFINKFQLSLTDKQQLTIIALGKLGACELNLSSDVDLIFTYDDSNSFPCNQSVQKITPQRFYTYVCQELIDLLKYPHKRRICVSCRYSPKA